MDQNGSTRSTTDCYTYNFYDHRVSALSKRCLCEVEVLLVIRLTTTMNKSIRVKYLEYLN
eukprot:snap_masked-scaffold_6-processed-gene-0.29-mRNA-1 protein AED:1.00 eAED:1.00 QI:0/0/0/0/1/1/3/0/59